MYWLNPFLRLLLHYKVITVSLVNTVFVKRSSKRNYSAAIVRITVVWERLIFSNAIIAQCPLLLSVTALDHATRNIEVSQEPRVNVPIMDGEIEFL